MSWLTISEAAARGRYKPRHIRKLIQVDVVKYDPVSDRVQEQSFNEYMIQSYRDIELKKRSGGETQNGKVSI